MPWVYIICFALIAAGLLTLFGVRPGNSIDALFRSQRKSATLTDELNVLMGTPAKGFFNQDFELKQILNGTGRADRYAVDRGAADEEDILLFQMPCLLVHIDICLPVQKINDLHFAVPVQRIINIRRPVNMEWISSIERQLIQGLASVSVLFHCCPPVSSFSIAVRRFPVNPTKRNMFPKNLAHRHSDE